MKTYLTLVNDAIRESGVDLDSVTTFASIQDTMQTRFVNWVKQAWDEIRTDRDNWQFQSRRAVLNISPRIYTGEGSSFINTTALTQTYTGAESGATFVVDTVNVISGDFSTSDEVAEIDIRDITGNMKINEQFTYDASSYDFVLKGVGRYDFNLLVSDLHEPDLTSFFIQDTGGSAEQTNTGSASLTHLDFVPYLRWLEMYSSTIPTLGAPVAFTIAPDGAYEFYPRPDKQYTLIFNYNADPAADLVVEADTPVGIPEQYQDMIMWLAVTYYAEYDESPGVLARANRRYMKYKDKMEQNEMPIMIFGRCVYDN